MMRSTCQHCYSGFFFPILLVTLLVAPARAQVQKISLRWEPREDLNILLPASIRIYEANGLLHDGAKVRAMYATVDLRDENLNLHAVGSNKLRETTLDVYKRTHAILAINGGYFSSTKSESLLVSDGEIIAPGPANFTRGAFGLVNRKPQIVWPYTIDSLKAIFQVKEPVELKKDEKQNFKTMSRWNPSQATGGGPMLVKEGKIRDGSKEEGFGASPLLRHPRTAIGYTNEHTLLMMVVDGRQQSSVGVTIEELAQIMLEAGCYEAVNLDGGGSSAMVAANEVVNIPTDIPNGNRNSLRKNASALTVLESRPSVDNQVILFDTESQSYTEHGVWQNTNHTNYYGKSASRQSIANYLNKASYRFKDIEHGKFQLAAWWTVNEKNTKRAAYILHRGNRIDSIFVDQTLITSNGRWNVLGNYELNRNDYIEIIGQSNGKLVTDAVRLVSIESLSDDTNRGDLRIAVISDLNSGLGSVSYEWQVDSIIRRIPRIWKPDLVVCGGDMVAGMGVKDTATLMKMWKGFDEHIAVPLREKNIPFAFTIGNHDGPRSYVLEREATTNYWKHSDHSTGLRFIDKSQFPHYYSFSAGAVFFISWDASSSEITKENLEWVEKQLESKEAQNARSRFVIGHLPIYSVAQERDSKGNVLENGDELRKLLEKYRVKVYISGHQHAYYPGKRGKLELLNAGAAGSGPRRWLMTDKLPVNTVTIMDVFYDRDTIIYSTYDIKHKDERDMTQFDHRELPSFITGVNGFLIRKDIEPINTARGIFYLENPIMDPLKSFGSAQASVENNQVVFTGTFNVKLQKTSDALTLCEEGRTGDVKTLFAIQGTTKGNKGTFKHSIELTEGMMEKLAVGRYFIELKSETGKLRARLFSPHNREPSQSTITTHNRENIYGVRYTNALYTIGWSPSADPDGDKVSYVYQLSTDSLFEKKSIIFHTNAASSFKRRESLLFELVKDKKTFTTFYHRVITLDGLHTTVGETSRVRFMPTTEEPDDFVELEAESFVLDGKIENATGQGSGAVWDKNGNLWLADYGGSLFVNDPDGKSLSFSPVQSVTINSKSYSLKPINGISLDLDGNILIGSNRYLFKLDSKTGKGIAVWEAPEGKRSITTPRVNDKGEVYALSLFAEDPNYVLKESATIPGTFDLVRTINLPQRILARTFDMSSDGRTLFFPDPGSALIQVYKSNDGVTYRRSDDITSVDAGCNAIHYENGRLTAAVRSSGISPATLHVRDEKKRAMWTLPLNDLSGAEARGIAVSPDEKTIIICVWDNGGGFYRYKKN